MSCYVCTDHHLSAILTFARRTDPTLFINGTAWDLRRDDHATALGAILKAENIRAFHHRYEGRHPAPDPGYRFRESARTPTPIEVLKAIQSLAYQLAEPPDWEHTLAMRILRLIQSTAIHELPGYGEARWEISE